MRSGVEALGKPRILIIDDDEELCRAMVARLQDEGFDAKSESNSTRGLNTALSRGWDAVVLDVEMPGLNGYVFLKQFRESRTTPVLMLSIRGAPVERIHGLELGADDYIAKPFEPRELIARLQAVLRRAGAAKPAAGLGESIRIDRLTLSRTANAAWIGNHELELTTIEFEMLAQLVKNAGSVVPRDELSRQVLGREYSGLDRSVDMHISKLRRKLQQHGKGRQLIKTVRNRGYLLPVFPAR